VLIFLFQTVPCANTCQSMYLNLFTSLDVSSVRWTLGHLFFDSWFLVGRSGCVCRGGTAMDCRRKNKTPSDRRFSILIFHDPVQILHFDGCLRRVRMSTPVTLPGVVALTASSFGAGPWLWRQRWAGLWHCSVPTSDEPWCCWLERLGLDWVRGELGAWGTGTGPQGNLLLRQVRATCYRGLCYSMRVFHTLFGSVIFAWHLHIWFQMSDSLLFM